MPTEAENIQYLYLILTNNGAPVIDWDGVGDALDLKKGAVTKRWSRLKQAMEAGETPSGSTYQFLWLCVKNSQQDKAMNWESIAKECSTTSGAAYKRYQRMKQAFNQEFASLGAGARSTANDTPTKPKATPKSKAGNKKTALSSGDGLEATPTPKPKRKRAPPAKKALAADETKIKPEPEDGSAGLSEEETKPKRARATKVNGTPKAKANNIVKKETGLPTLTTEATTLVKGEHDESDGTFYSALEEHGTDSSSESEVDNEDMSNRIQDWLYTCG